MQTAYNTLDASSAKATYGSRQEKADCRADRKALLLLVRKLVAYVNLEADGDEQKLAGCGLRLSKTPQPSVLGTAQPSLVYEGTSGELTLATPVVEGARSYKHQYTTDADNGPWLEVVTSRSKCKLVNLSPGTTYISRIVTIGTGGRQTVSEVVTRKAG